MRLRYFIVFVGFFLLLTALGCSGLKNDPIEKNYFDLEIKLPGLHQDNIPKGATLLVKSFLIDTTFDSHSFVYRIGKNEYTNDFYNEFVSYPAGLITEIISEALYATPRFTSGKNGINNGINNGLTYRLSGKISRLFADFRNPDDPKAVIEIRMILEKKDNKRFKTVLNKTYFSERPMESRQPDHLVSAWNKLLAGIVTEFVNDFPPSG